MATVHNRNNALILLENLRDMGYTDHTILTALVNDILSGSDACKLIEEMYDYLDIESTETLKE